MMWCDAISRSFLRQPVVWKMACAKTGSDNQQKKHRIRGAFFVKASKRKKCTCTSLETKFLSSWNEHIGWVMMSHYGLKYWMFTFSYQSINPEIHGSLIIESSNFERVFSLFFAMTSVERVSSMEYNKFGNTVPWVFEQFGNWAKKIKQFFPKVRQPWSLAAATERGAEFQNRDWPRFFVRLSCFSFFVCESYKKTALGGWMKLGDMWWFVFFGKADKSESSFGGGWILAGTKPFWTELADAKKALWIGQRVDVQVFGKIASDIHRTESRWLAIPKRWRVVRGHDEIIHVGGDCHLFSRWYTWISTY